MKYRLLAPALYPIRGLLYFLYHPTLFKSCIELILRLFLLTVGVWLALWFTTYDVQYFVLAKVFGRGFLGRSATLGALLAEAIVPVYLLSERFTRAVSHRLFDTVLKQQGLRQPSSTSKQERTALQTNFREQQQYHSEQQREWGVLWRVCTWITNIFLQPKATESAFRQYLRMACTTPILALGPIGPLAFSYLNGFGSTATLLDHYLIQKDLKQSAEREAWYQLHKQEFRIFGAVVFAMNAIPVVNFLFRFTNTVGAALWAADIEKNKTFISGKPQRRDASPLKSLTSTITQVQSLGSSPMTRSQKAAHKIIASGTRILVYQSERATFENNMAYRALAKAAQKGSRLASSPSTRISDEVFACSSAAIWQHARHVQTFRLTCQEAVKNAMAEAPAGTTWKDNAIIYDYTKESKPNMSPIPIQAWDAAGHETGDSRVVHLDLSKDLNTEWPATSMNLLASFVRVKAGESLTVQAKATSQTFYVIRGDGYSDSEFGKVRWAKGDVWSVPGSGEVTHHASKESTEHGGAAFYWVTDEPLCNYLGVTPTEHKFEPVHYTKDALYGAVEKLKEDPEASKSNRLGVLLGTHQTLETKTNTHVLWVLFNTLPPHTTQKPHRHTPTALDFCITAPKTGVYTAMAQSIDKDGNLIDPIKAPWKTGGAFTTPPGWWHSHVNETDEPAWVLPIQDAGLLTHQRILDIRFVPGVLEQSRRQEVLGASFEGVKSYV